MKFHVHTLPDKDTTNQEEKQVLSCEKPEGITPFEFNILTKNGCSPAIISAYAKYQRLGSRPDIGSVVWEMDWQAFAHESSGFGLAMVAINILGRIQK